MFNLDLVKEQILSFDEAVEQHGMIKKCLTDMARDVRHESNEIRESARTIIGYARDAWNQCMGVGDPDSVMATAIRTCIPLNYVPLLRMRSGIPAGYYIVQLVDLLFAAAKSSFDLTDDLVLREVARSAFVKFEWHRQNAALMEEGFGFDRSEAWAQMRKVEDRSGQVSQTMKRIASLAGRMLKAFQNVGVPQRTDDPHEITGVNTGGDVDRLLDDEAASVGIDPEALVRISEDRAYQYRMTGERPKSRGPLVIAIDESGSMHGTREIWGKACAVALARTALNEGRAVKAVHFSHAIDVHDVTTNPDDMTLLSESHVSGGTDIDTAVAVSLDRATKMEAMEGKEGADIVFITDGLDSYSKHYFDKMVELGVNLWTVAIDIDIKAVADANARSRGYSGASGWLYTYARAYVHLSDDVIARCGDKAIDAAVELRQAALDNSSRVD